MNIDTGIWLLGPGTCRMSELASYSRAGSKAPLVEKFDTLKEIGVTSFSFLSESIRQEMLLEATGLPYTRRTRERPTGVFQKVYESHRLPLDGILMRFALQYTLKLLASLPPLKPEEYFSTELRPNDLCVQKYDESSFGIRTDADGQSDMNLVSLFILGGEADFFIFDNREGANPRQIDTTPGNAILMRANGFCGHTNTPIHRVSNVRSERYVLSVRQKV